MVLIANSVKFDFDTVPSKRSFVNDTYANNSFHRISRRNKSENVKKKAHWT